MGIKQEKLAILQKQAYTIRFLVADMVQNANSGHPGSAMGLADIAVMLGDYIKYNPKNPYWLNRDRLVFSGGHVSALAYSLFYLWGYNLDLKDLKDFRQIIKNRDSHLVSSKTPGHLEYGVTEGVESTTGPLGQGIANAVGFALASKLASSKLNNSNTKIIDHKIYCLCGDGDIQEGISYEACSIAGHNCLDNLILIYDSNDITIDGNVSLAFSENVKNRFRSQGWNVLSIDGHDFCSIKQALDSTKKQIAPCLIIAKTKIAKGSHCLEGSRLSHGSPLGKEDIESSKKIAGFNPKKFFFIDEDILKEFRLFAIRGSKYNQQWNESIKEASKAQLELLNRYLMPDLNKIKWPSFKNFDSISTRKSNGLILNQISRAVLGFVGGSADLSSSNKSYISYSDDFPDGKNIHFGIREHAMGAIINSFALYGLFIPYCATFFVFSDYLKPSVRLAALMGTKNYFIWTHDSIGVGEDGPTHQPIEHLTQFRALPNFFLFRPADANENLECWKTSFNIKKSPCAFVLSRQNLPILDKKDSFGDISYGGYLVKSLKNPKVTLISSGSEVHLALNVAKILQENNISTNVVSIPCFKIFDRQEEEYKKSIIQPHTKKVAIEASSALEWFKYADEVIGMSSFGASGEADKLFEKFNFTPKSISNKVLKFLG